MSSNKSYLSYFDLGVTPNPVFIKGYHQYRSLYCGIISMILIIIFILYSVSKFAIMTTSFTQEQSSSKYKEVSFDIDFIQFNMSVNLIDDSRYLKITQSNMYENGLQIQLLQKGERWQNHFQLEMNQFQDFILPRSNQMHFHSSQYDKTLYEIQIKQCDMAKHTKCRPLQDRQNKVLHISYATRFNSDDFYFDQKSQFMKFYYAPYEIHLDKQDQFQRTIFPMHQYDITYDDSVLPSILSSSYFQKRSWCFIQDQQITEKIYNKTDVFFNKRQTLKNENVTSQHFNINNQNITTFQAFRFKTDNQVYKYKFMAQKIQYVLPQLFTILSIMMAAIKGISSHYRRWCIKIEAANALALKNNKQNPSDKDQFIIQHNLKNYFIFHIFKGKAIKRIQLQKERIQQANQSNDNFERRSPQNIKQFEKNFKLKYTADKMQEVDMKLDYLQMCKQIHSLRSVIGMLCTVIKDNNLKMNRKIQEVVQKIVIENNNDNDNLKLYKKYMDFNETDQIDRIEDKNNFNTQQQIKKSLMSQ